MTFAQIHERLRQEQLRRIERGSLSVSLLARQTGFGQSHISNVLRGKRQFSLKGMDRVMLAQQIVVSDLLPSRYEGERASEGFGSNVPVVTHSAALFEPTIRTSTIQAVVQIPASILQQARARPAANRAAWQRFVAVCVSAADAAPMDPVVLPNALVVIDRHYHSLVPYRTSRANVYAVRHGHQLKLRYLDFEMNRMILRPHNLAFPVELAQPGPEQTPGNLIAGRVILILNEL